MIIDRHHCSPGLRIKFLLSLYWICLDLALDCQLLYYHTTHRNFLKIHRRDKNVSTIHISLYKNGNVTEIHTFSLEYFW